MKKVISLFLLLFLLLSAQSFADVRIIVGGGTSVVAFDCAPYDTACQQLEAAGYDNSETWTESPVDATINENYSASPIAGGQSLSMADGGAEGYVTHAFGVAHSDLATTGVFFQLRIDSDTDALHHMVKLLDGASVAASLRLNLTTGYLSIGCGVVANGSIDVSEGGVWDVWWEWETGPDGTSSIYTCLHSSCNGVKPSVDATTSSCSNNYPGIDSIQIFVDHTVTQILDTILVDTIAIGNVPNIPAAD